MELMLLKNILKTEKERVGCIRLDKFWMKKMNLVQIKCRSQNYFLGEVIPEDEEEDEEDKDCSVLDENEGLVVNSKQDYNTSLNF